MPVARLELLGGFRLRDPSGAEIAISAKKNQGLMAILAVSRGRTISREKMTGLLWSDRSEEQARSSLRQSLVVLRRELGLTSRVLMVEADQLGLREDGLEIDVFDVQTLAAKGDLASLRAAAAHCRGQLIDGLFIHDDSFETWLRNARERFNDIAIDVNRRVVELETGAGRIEAAKRLVGLDPLREDSHRALMRAYAMQGEVALARKQYNNLKEMLQRELSTKLSAETERLASELGATANRSEEIQSDVAPKDTQLTLAVLPFANLNNDPDQALLCRGITEDIVTELSRMRPLMVRLAQMKPGTEQDERDGAGIGKALGTQYVLDGSLRRMGNRMRISAQLIECASGQHLWGDRFDESEDAFFSVQDTIVRRIVSTLVGRMLEDGARQASRKTPTSLAAYQLVLQADNLPFHEEASLNEMRRLCKMALNIDPSYARAYALLATIDLHEWFQLADSTVDALADGLRKAETSVKLDSNDSYCRATIGDFHLQMGEFDKAEHHFRRALELNPNRPGIVLALGRFHIFAGEPEEAARYFREASEIDPYFTPAWYWHDLGYLNFVSGRYDEAVAAMNKSPDSSAWISAYKAAYSQLAGREIEAKRYMAEALSKQPGFSSAKNVSKEPFKKPDHRALLLEALIKAGLPP